MTGTTDQSNSASPVRHADPVVGIIYNPRSHRNQGQDLDVASLPNVHVRQPAQRTDIPKALAELAAFDIDFLIINGGDGTVRDVLSCGQVVFGDSWPDLAVLPKGKTNALNVDLGAPAGWTLAEAIAAYPGGRRIRRRPISITPKNGGSETISGCGPSMLGFIMGGGAFTTGIRAGQDAHRMGAFNSLAVGVTSVWGVLQGLFGSDSNIWRRGTPMQIHLGSERAPMPHSGHGDPATRSIFLASTLEKFPAGIKLFSTEHSGLRLAVLDKPRRRTLAKLPLYFSGILGSPSGKGGFHQVAADEFELQIGDQYILDGEAYPPGTYVVASGPELNFVVP
ncbi:hypothetical protein GRI43_10430 [Altererythrobacter luteolus]|uniref:DAGKc domain-containing protein n=1 Tax=Pontixanthobacter luteolus TaxID=295089 RepID=A0A6I4V1X5_9SPHN|nr:diacylglycerol kinase family protein [Pontixanthobacter luteolus]MXP47798.1 hypothetical protein [Pontixanthobacter luteolus]